MMGIATGRYSIIRGESTLNDYGDEVETDTVIRESVQGSVIERSRTNFDPESGRIATLRQLTGRFAHGTDIKDGDRIKDEESGKVYLVTSVFNGSSLVGKADIVLDLRFA